MNTKIEVNEIEEVEEFAHDAQIIKADPEKRLVYGVVYPVFKSGVADHQGDFAGEDEVERMAHDFILKMIVHRNRFMDNQHEYDVEVESAAPVESYIAPVDFEMGGVLVTKGSWVMVTKLLDDDLWEDAKNGKIGAYSIKGYGRRTAVEV